MTGYHQSLCSSDCVLIGLKCFSCRVFFYMDAECLCVRMCALMRVIVSAIYDCMALFCVLTSGHKDISLTNLSPDSCLTVESVTVVYCFMGYI